VKSSEHEQPCKNGSVLDGMAWIVRWKNMDLKMEKYGSDVQVPTCAECRPKELGYLWMIPNYIKHSCVKLTSMFCCINSQPLQALVVNPQVRFDIPASQLLRPFNLSDQLQLRGVQTTLAFHCPGWLIGLPIIDCANNDILKMVYVWVFYSIPRLYIMAPISAERLQPEGHRRGAKLYNWASIIPWYPL